MHPPPGSWPGWDQERRVPRAVPSRLVSSPVCGLKAIVCAETKVASVGLTCPPVWCVCLGVVLLFLMPACRLSGRGKRMQDSPAPSSAPGGLAPPTSAYPLPLPPLVRRG